MGGRTTRAERAVGRRYMCVIHGAAACVSAPRTTEVHALPPFSGTNVQRASGCRTTHTASYRIGLMYRGSAAEGSRSKFSGTTHAAHPLITMLRFRLAVNCTLILQVTHHPPAPVSNRDWCVEGYAAAPPQTFETLVDDDAHCAARGHHQMVGRRDGERRQRAHARRRRCGWRCGKPWLC